MNTSTSKATYIYVSNELSYNTRYSTGIQYRTIYITPTTGGFTASTQLYTYMFSDHYSDIN